MTDDLCPCGRGPRVWRDLMCRDCMEDRYDAADALRDQRRFRDQDDEDAAHDHAERAREARQWRTP